MSIEIMNLCWNLELESSVAKFVLISLADNANHEGACYPSIKYIARRTSCSERTVHRALGYLESIGLIKKSQRRTEHNRCMSNYYTINIRAIHQELGVTECHAGGDTVSGGRVTQCQGEGDTVSGKPPENHNLEPNPPNPPKGGQKVDTIPYQQIIESYKTHCTNLKGFKVLTDKRKRQIKKLWNLSSIHQTIAFWDSYFAACNTDPFYQGVNDRNWQADIEYLTRPEVFAKNIEKFA